MQTRPEIKFAVVREDPHIELELIEREGIERVLAVTSAGDTLMAIRHARPEVEVVGFDANPLQLEHASARAQAIARGDLEALGVGRQSAQNLSQRGAFERLLRLLRASLLELVAPEAELEAFFSPQTPPARREALRQGWADSPYWPVSFELAFADPLVRVMFGPEAVQHAPEGSYPGYFQRVFERGLARPGAAQNPFLQHILLQRYLPQDAPAHLRAGRDVRPHRLLHARLPEVEGLERFDLIGLSNLFDWMDEDEAQATGAAIAARATSGALVLVRQLNNARPLAPYFQGRVVFDDALGRALWARERSLFYETVRVGRVQ